MLQPTVTWDPVASAAYQWAFGHGGGVLHEQLLLKGIEPRKAFDNLVKEREKAKIAFERERERASRREIQQAGKRCGQKGKLLQAWSTDDGMETERPGKVKDHWSFTRFWRYVDKGQTEPNSASLSARSWMPHLRARPFILKSFQGRYYLVMFRVRRNKLMILDQPLSIKNLDLNALAMTPGLCERNITTKISGPTNFLDLHYF